MTIAPVSPGQYAAPPRAPAASGLGPGLLALVAAVALAARLVPVLRGGGLSSSISYDGSVYYAAAAGLAHGLMPYRDFLLLHPPGIVVALLPFAALGRLVGDPAGMASARAAFLLVGVANALLVSRVLRPLGRFAAVVGGLFYAVFLPAVYMDRSVSLEGAATLCLLGSLVILAAPRSATSLGPRTAALAGVPLGWGVGVKIWGVVVVLAVLVWCGRALGARYAAVTAAGAAVGLGMLCAPFFLAAPQAMWRMVVLDQLGRPHDDVLLATRAGDLLGLSGPGAFPVPASGLLLVAALALVVLTCVLAGRTSAGALGVLLLVLCGALLLVTPTWFAHYAGLTAAPAALVVGAASGTALRGLRPWPARALVVSVLAAALAAATVTSLTRTFGVPFPGRALASAAATAPGCVTSDDPTALIESDLLRRNLGRGCLLVVDLGGYSYDLPTRGARYPRSDHEAWQGFALHYLESGSVTVIGRFRRGSGFSPDSADVVEGWPEVAQAGPFVVRRPAPSATG